MALLLLQSIPSDDLMPWIISHDMFTLIPNLTIKQSVQEPRKNEEYNHCK